MMITYRTFAEVPEDRRVVLTLPPETPIGNAEITVTVTANGVDSTPGKLRSIFGAVRSGNPRSADNDALDADLTKEYGHPNE